MRVLSYETFVQGHVSRKRERTIENRLVELSHSPGYPARLYAVCYHLSPLSCEKPFLGSTYADVNNQIEIANGKDSVG
jgi:hypothetical protein